MLDPALWFARECVTGLGPFAKVRLSFLVLDAKVVTCFLEPLQV